MPMYKTRNDLSQNLRKSVCELLNGRLADAIDLKYAVKQAHWTVKGPNFIALHELFDQIQARLDAPIDDMAERIATLGGTPEGTAQVAAKRSSLKPYPLDLEDGKDHLEALAARLAGFGKAVRAAIDESDKMGDADTADLFTGISRAIDKDLWFLEAHLQAKG
jgi:starvation-inducible DNA-binding protein